VTRSYIKRLIEKLLLSIALALIVLLAALGESIIIGCFNLIMMLGMFVILILAFWFLLSKKWWLE